MGSFFHFSILFCFVCLWNSDFHGKEKEKEKEIGKERKGKERKGKERKGRKKEKRMGKKEKRMGKREKREKRGKRGEKVKPWSSFQVDVRETLRKDGETQCDIGQGSEKNDRR